MTEVMQIERHVAELMPASSSTCPESLGIAALSGRLEQLRKPMQLALAQFRRHEEIKAKPWPENVKRAVLENRVATG